ncbi:MAG TPA: dihydrofolate reductase family protein [Candidatus Paceibacterota bacterium]|nr:dihydrofolate reductase family protein [Candidatus Paceibacterota bacterium]
MKTFIIAALTADGYIAQNEKHAAFWTSKDDKKRFVELTKQAGVVVMGSITFSTLPKPLKERINIVYSRSKTFEGAETTQKPPAELIKELESRGLKEVAICGGAKIYSMFMKANVVDYLYLTIEPVMFGNGIRLFDQDMLHRLKLENVFHTENGTVMLEYKVEYSDENMVLK